MASTAWPLMLTMLVPRASWWAELPPMVPLRHVLFRVERDTKEVRVEQGPCVVGWLTK